MAIYMIIYHFYKRILSTILSAELYCNRNGNGKIIQELV